MTELVRLTQFVSAIRGRKRRVRPSLVRLLMSNTRLFSIYLSTREILILVKFLLKSCLVRSVPSVK